jgi:glycosyltransferase involved in cell wall biosynthesis
VVSWNQHLAYRQRNHHSEIAVKHKFTDDKDVKIISNDLFRSTWSKFLRRTATGIDQKPWPLNAQHRIAALLRLAAEPGRSIRKWLGIEEFNYPASRELEIDSFDVIHCHVLHGDYFDLRNLKEWSLKKPVVVTLHDAWLLAGHCAHSFDCQLWRSGCSRCPDLSIPVAIERDNAALNWRRKRDIYKKSNLYITTPCQWLMNKVEKSILNEGTRKKRVITNGVDHRIFKRIDKAYARKEIGIENDALVLLFSANGIKRSRWKDFKLMRRALELVSMNQKETKIIFLALGEDAPREVLGSNAEIRFVPFRSRPEEVVLFYNACDIYLHAAKADTFPNAVLEAIACGVPVVATAVGGIPEQIKGLRSFGNPDINAFADDAATGILTPEAQPESFAAAVEHLAKNKSLITLLGMNAEKDSMQRFSLARQADDYLNWYAEIIKDFNNELIL